MKGKIIRIVFFMILLLTSRNNLYAQNTTVFTNPILAGFYPDPSICKAGSDYYLVNSTFAYFPGIPIFHSNDLVNWKLIGHALNRPEQLNLDGFGVSRGIFAPAIRYNDGMFYLTCTLVDGGGNFIVKSEKPEGPWSNPIWLPEINGIDPSLFFDTDGKTYITYNSDAPDNKPLYDGHRTVRIAEFDIANMKVISEPEILINGGVDFSKKPIWIEGPHIYKINDVYYLTAAEGGTAEDHSQVILRSQSVCGPYIPYDKNPILTQRHLDPKREYPVTCTGHADFVQTDTGEWWAVFLGCRPYKPFEKNYYNTGRETFLAPVKWTENDDTGAGWPVIITDNENVQFHYALPIEPTSGEVDIPYSGNFTLRDNFEKAQLHPSWIFLRTPHEKWYDLNRKEGYVSIRLRPETCSGKMNPSFIARRQQHSIGYSMLSLQFTPQSENEKAGLLIFQDENHFYYLCKSIKGTEEVIELYKSTADSVANNMELLASDTVNNNKEEHELILKIETMGNEYAFYYGNNPNDLKLLKDKVDATYLSIKKAWGFTGNVLAMYATSLGQLSNSTAYYDWFEYNGNDYPFQIHE